MKLLISNLRYVCVSRHIFGVQTGVFQVPPLSDLLYRMIGELEPDGSNPKYEAFVSCTSEPVSSSDHFSVGTLIGVGHHS